MPHGIFKTINIPKDKVQKVIKGYEIDKPTKIERERQTDGLWTVIATFPGPGMTETVHVG